MPERCPPQADVGLVPGVVLHQAIVGNDLGTQHLCQFLFSIGAVRAQTIDEHDLHAGDVRELLQQD